jgi:hypothetical protein
MRKDRDLTERVVHTRRRCSRTPRGQRATLAGCGVSERRRRFGLIPHDVTCPLNIEADQIHSLACSASPIHFQHDPVQTTKTGVHGAQLVRGRTANCRRLSIGSHREANNFPEIEDAQ